VHLGVSFLLQNRVGELAEIISENKIELSMLEFSHLKLNLWEALRSRHTLPLNLEMGIFQNVEKLRVKLFKSELMLDKDSKKYLHSTLARFASAHQQLSKLNLLELAQLTNDIVAYLNYALSAQQILDKCSSLGLTIIDKVIDLFLETIKKRPPPNISNAYLFFQHITYRLNRLDNNSSNL
jgi:hypothetical protein